MRKRTLPVFLYSWVVNTLALLVASNLINGIQNDTFSGLITASFILSLLHAFLRPVLFVLSIPFLLITLGLFTAIINATLLYWVGSLVKTFHVGGFLPAIFGAILVSVINLVCDFLFSPKEISGKMIFRRKSSRKNRKRDPSEGKGPIIDV